MRQDLPQQAIECRHFADIVPLGASVQALRGTDFIMWTIKFRNGNMKRFKFAIRTTPEGSADPAVGRSNPDRSKLEAPDFLFNEDLHACDMSQFNS